MATQYSFVTHWQINAPIEKVWNEIYDSLNWQFWWKGVLKVTKILQGDENGIGEIREYTWKSILPYKLTFKMQLTQNEKHKTLSGIAFGELQGNGTWLFEQKNNITLVTYYWNVYTTKSWMNYFSFILKPIFSINHNVVMYWGKQCLKKRVEPKK